MIHLAGDLDSDVVGADSNIGRVGESKGCSSNSMSVIGSLDDMSSSIGSRENMASGIGGRDKVEGELGLGITLHNMLNSMVLGNVFGSESSIGDSSVVVGVVEAGETVGSRGNNTVVDNRRHSRVDNRRNNRVDNRRNNRVDSRVGGYRADMRVGGDRVDGRVGGHGSNSVDSSNMGNRSIGGDRDTSSVDSSGLSISISITLSNGVDNRGSIDSVEAGVGSESSEERRAVGGGVGSIVQRSSSVHNLRFRLSEGNSGQSENSKHLHVESV